MQGASIDISRFRFNSLHKYMHVIYATLNQNIDLPPEEKRQLVRKALQLFFRRLRRYRRFSLTEISEKTKIPLEHIVRFERTGVEEQWNILGSYLKICGGFVENEYFQEKIREFMSPGLRESKEEQALNLLKRFGVMMPGIDYKLLHQRKGAVLSFSKESKSASVEHTVQPRW